VHEITLELVGAYPGCLDHDVVHNAAEAVLHYFKAEKGQSTVSMAEFSEALERALHGLGLEVKHFTMSPSGAPASEPPPVVETDLLALAEAEAQHCELLFFSRLRDALRSGLSGSPRMLRFHGLRACVKRLTGASRWTSNCQQLNDQIVEFLRACLTSEIKHDGFVLDVR
jgi:hypothetical protein